MPSWVQREAPAEQVPQALALSRMLTSIVGKRLDPRAMQRSVSYIEGADPQISCRWTIRTAALHQKNN